MHVQLLRATRSKGDPITCSQDAVKLMTAEESEADRECFWVLHLNGRHRLTKKECVAVGSANSAIVHPREVFKRGVILGSAALICLHNHPSGDPSPSPEDIALWTRLDNAGELLGIPVIDHIILGRQGQYYSKKDRGL